MTKDLAKRYARARYLPEFIHLGAVITIDVEGDKFNSAPEFVIIDITPNKDLVSVDVIPVGDLKKPNPQLVLLSFLPRYLFEQKYYCVIVDGLVGELKVDGELYDIDKTLRSSGKPSVVNAADLDALVRHLPFGATPKLNFREAVQGLADGERVRIVGHHLPDEHGPTVFVKQVGGNPSVIYPVPVRNIASLGDNGPRLNCAEGQS